MLVIETENPDMENYLKVIVGYLKDNLCQEMNLSELNNIKAVDSSKLPRNVDARIEDDTILLSVSSIRQAIESISLYELATHLEQDIEEINSNVMNLLNNIYHEFCHINERAISPNIHSAIEDEKPFLEKLVAHFWIEYIVECKSRKKHFKSPFEYCDSFVRTKWDIQYMRVNRDDAKDLYWLIYTMAYFIALCFINDCFDYYLRKITDKQISQLVQQLYIVCKNLYNEEPFDDYKKIKIIGEIFEKTFNTKKSKNFEELYC